MSNRKDTDAKSPARRNPRSARRLKPSSTASEQQISLSLPEPADEPRRRNARRAQIEAPKPDRHAEGHRDAEAGRGGAEGGRGR